MICQKRLVRVKENAAFILNQICFIFTLQEFNKYYYRLSEMESFSLTYSRMVVSSSAYRESSGSNQLSVMETSNINKNKPSAQIYRTIEQSFKKELQQKIQADNRPPCQIFDGIDKESDAVFEESSTEYNIKQIFNYRLNNDSNSLDPYTEILCSVIEQKKILTTLQMKASHSFKKLHFALPKNLQWFYSWIKQQKIWNAFLYKVSIK